MDPSRPRIRAPRRGSALAATALLAVVAAAAAGSSPTATAPAAPGASATGHRLGADPRPGTADPSEGGSCALSPGAGAQMSEGLPTAPGYVRGTGTVRALTLAIDFPDAPGRGTARQRYAEFFPQVRQWFRTASYGRLDYRPALPLTHWLRMPHSFRSYGIERGSTFEPGYRRLLRDLARAAAAARPAVDFGPYDLVNVLVTPNAGPPATDTVLSVTFSGNADAPSADGVPLANVSFIYGRQTGPSAFRVLSHENGHVFGLPDLYTDAGGGSLAGHWDLMSEDWGPGNDVMAWHKWKLGWLTGRQVRCVTGRGAHTERLTSLNAPGGGVRLVFVPVTRHSGYAVEVRRREGNDESVCRPGVLVSWVDASVDTGGGPVTVVDSTPHSGGCSRSPNVDAELSDAAFTPGQAFTDRRLGVRIEVSGGERHGEEQRNYQVRIVRR
ncbi:M6 family metalloprotease domain-containing protein [Streptomyces sp. NPDC050610]|uniref:M6 family metalloprotease domain-containing protein n=1 Tax=Streptomyces sp. NPDC050610 TaxID=3157097 RepID=UPI003441ED71